jgi:hypothetical protein
MRSGPANISGFFFRSKTPYTSKSVDATVSLIEKRSTPTAKIVLIERGRKKKVKLHLSSLLPDWLHFRYESQLALSTINVDIHIHIILFNDYGKASNRQEKFLLSSSILLTGVQIIAIHHFEPNLNQNIFSLIILTNIPNGFI